MAAKVNGETVEAKTMREHYANLTKTIQDPLGLATELYSADVIAKKVLDSTLEFNCTRVEKTMHLLQAVRDQITINPKVFHSFLTVLKKDSSLRATAELIDSTFRHQNQGDYEQRKDEDITYRMYPKRPKLSTEHEEHVSVKMKCQDIWLSWKRCSPLPGTIAEGTAVVIGNKVYCSRKNPSKIYEYEIIQNVWSNEIECPRHNFSLAVLDRLLTLVGGSVTTPGSSTNTLLSLIDNPTNVGTKYWSESYKSMQNERASPAIASNCSYFVVAGGDTPATVEVMELSTQDWQGPSTLPKNDGYISSATIIEDKLYLTYGHSRAGSLCPVNTCSLTALLKDCKSSTTQNVVKPLLWQKLLDGPPLYKPMTVQLCGNLLAVGGYMTCNYNVHKEMDVYNCQGSVYVYDEQSGKWSFVSQLPSNSGFPDNAFAVASLSEDKVIVMGGTQYCNDDEFVPDSDIVHIGSVDSFAKLHGI